MATSARPSCSLHGGNYRGLPGTALQTCQRKRLIARDETPATTLMSRAGNRPRYRERFGDIPLAFRPQDAPMPRRPRLTLPNVPLHLIQHGNKRQACLIADEGFRGYLVWLGEYGGKIACQVRAYRHSEVAPISWTGCGSKFKRSARTRLSLSGPSFCPGVAARSSSASGIPRLNSGGGGCTSLRSR